VTNLVVLPLFYFMYCVDNFAVAIVCDFLAFFIGETFISLSFAMLVNVSSLRVVAMRNT
jgi:hypothetical protein